MTGQERYNTAIAHLKSAKNNIVYIASYSRPLIIKQNAADRLRCKDGDFQVLDRGSWGSLTFSTVKLGNMQRSK